jgi:hypothetical protein
VEVEVTEADLSDPLSDDELLEDLVFYLRQTTLLLLPILCTFVLTIWFVRNTLADDTTRVRCVGQGVAWRGRQV